MDLLAVPLGVLERTWNAVIAARPELREQTAALAGGVVAVALEGLDRRFVVVIEGARLQLTSAWEDDVDATIAGTPVALAALGAGREGGLFRGEVRIEGDVETGRAFRTLLDGIAAHWEVPLADLVGEASAARLRAAADTFAAWGQETLLTLARDFAGYLQGEAGMLAHHGEVVQFLDAVDTLRADVDRLVARVRRLEGCARP